MMLGKIYKLTLVNYEKNTKCGQRQVVTYHATREGAMSRFREVAGTEFQCDMLGLEVESETTCDYRVTRVWCSEPNIEEYEVLP